MLTGQTGLKPRPWRCGPGAVSQHQDRSPEHQHSLWPVVGLPGHKGGPKGQDGRTVDASWRQCFGHGCSISPSALSAHPRRSRCLMLLLQPDVQPGRWIMQTGEGVSMSSVAQRLAPRLRRQRPQPGLGRGHCMGLTVGRAVEHDCLDPSSTRRRFRQPRDVHRDQPCLVHRQMVHADAPVVPTADLGPRAPGRIQVAPVPTGADVAPGGGNRQGTEENITSAPD